MVSADLLALAAGLRGNIFVDAKVIDSIVGEVNAGRLDEYDAAVKLRKLRQDAEQGPFYLSAREADKEWVALLDAMAIESQEWQKIAKSQFFQGFWILPIGVIIIIGTLVILAWLVPTSTLVSSPILAACLAGVGLHAFLVFRVHQQARAAAERLSEKRAAILFLRLAIGRTNADEVAQLLSAGTAMFLGHHAVAAVPLQADDFPRR